MVIFPVIFLETRKDPFGSVGFLIAWAESLKIIYGTFSTRSGDRLL
jgi:hypothetical protein